MSARPGASPVGTVRARRLARLAAVLAAAATLAAACSGSPQGAEPTVASLDPASAPTSSESTSTTVEDDDQESNDGAAGVAEGEGGSAVRDGAAGSGTTDGSPGAVEEAAPGAGEGEAPEGAGSEQAAADDGVSEGGSAYGGSSGRAASGAAASGHGATGDGVLEPFVTGPIAPLTGSLTTDLSLAERRVLAVKVGNGDSKDRPQAGLAAADIVYEVLVEAGFTRFIAVLHSEIPSRVGPVRSARSSDFDILEDLATPYLATSGANSTVRRQMSEAARSGTLIDIGAGRMGAPYRRDRSRPAPHNLYFHYERLGGGDPDSLPGGIPDTPPAALFEYGSSNSPPLDDAAGVTVAYTILYGGEASHVWDPILGGWVRIQDGTLHTTETDFGLAEIAPANVVVLWMPYDRSAADRRSPQALSYGGGQALVLTAGSVHEAVWERTEDRVGYRFTDAAGNPLTLSTGSTWLLLANTSRRWPQAEVTVLTVAESNQLLADARERSEQEQGS
ncbi:MAG: DUF3048 domain-containing protein [Acidimicrobiaceae bacterium]|nr:DUF3048 domain-containing protein [Acidimicrobiaceae bacterium]MYI36383.1 DUF3048 domain-containing protein [Acidimicrobiaceae bacterium]